MTEQRNPWVSTRNILILVIALAVAGGVVNLFQAQSRMRQIRSDRLRLAELAAANRLTSEAGLARQEPGPLRDWHASLVKHYADLEARYLRGAAIPSEPMPPAPEQPPHPSLQELMEWEEAKRKGESSSGGP